MVDSQEDLAAHGHTSGNRWHHNSKLDAMDCVLSSPGASCEAPVYPGPLRLDNCVVFQNSVDRSFVSIHRCFCSLS
jgi:hypothetical protein